MFLHLRRSRLLLSFIAFLLSIGSISIFISHSSQSADSKFPSFEQIDRICNGRRTKCFQVVDRIIPSSGEEEMVTRSLEILLPSGSTFIESKIRIRPVKHNATFVDSDTRLWKVDGEELESEYLRAMAIMPFLTRVFRLGRRKEQKKIALIGEGGASLLSHLRTLRDGIDTTIVEKEKNVVELSKRWFDVGEAVVVTADAIEWMRRKDDNATRYDVIFLDACERRSAQHCPDPLFTKEENVRSLHRILKDDTRALVVINFEIYHHKKWEMLHQQMDVLLSIFSHCISIDLKEGINMIVGCFTRPLPFYNSENQRASLDASMGFIVDQYSEAQSELLYGRIFNEFGVHSTIDGKRETILHPVDKQI
ncbi:hypothetical protein PENTCL1PPCAC_27068 [Pristionchus entomophagus]|uniref:Uncharacterized protein n=1 Tax=Pristionchus entomophagus TaxID=358040 RepID=A0AAV5UD53_9BILA|nr:hypothetical protein PENTCL1PPCAC_27068 [Pristionchus entomophagus]